MAVAENTGINSTAGEAIEFSDFTLSSIFNFVDSTLSAINIVNDSIQNDYKDKLQKGIGYCVRGFTANLLPSNTPKTITGSKISVSTVKINLNGFDTTVNTTFTSQDGNNVAIRIPKTALGSRKYTQMSAIFTSDLVYNVITVNSGSSIKTGILKLILDETDSTMDIASTKVKTSQITIANLTTPIEIDIPFSGSIGEDNTLACGYTLQANDVISSTGITTMIHSNYCTCKTTHLTDFMLEEYLDIRNVDELVNQRTKSVNKLRVERSVAFWLSLIMILSLPVFLFLGYKFDKNDITKYGPEGPPGIKYYTLFMAVWLSVRSKEKAESENKKQGQSDEDEISNGNNDFNDQTNNDASYVSGNNASMSDMNLMRRKVSIIPVVSNFWDDDESDREESKEDKIQINDQRVTGINHIQIGILETVDEDEKKQEYSNSNRVQKHALIKNAEEIKEEPVISNIFEKEQPLTPPKVEIDTGEVTDEEQEKIQKQLRKRKKKRRKPRVPHNFVEDNIIVAEPIEKAENQISKGHKITFDSSKLNKIKRESRYSDDEFEGGDENEGTEANTTDMNTGNATNNNVLSPSTMNVIECPIQSKKKKKFIKKLKKKKKSKNIGEDKSDDRTLYFDATDDIPTALEPRIGKNTYKSRATSSVMDSISDNESKAENLDTIDNQVYLDPNHVPITLDEPKKKEEDEKDKDYVYHDKAEERHYDGKFFCKSMKYGNRFSNMMIFYDERNPRIHRVLIVFNSWFIVLFLSGVFFIGSGDTNDVNGYGPLACFGISIFCTVIDWFMYILSYCLFLHKPRHYKNQKYMIEQNIRHLDQTNEDITDAGKSKFGSSQSGRKMNNLDEDKKKKSINRIITLLSFIFSASLMLTCWVFIMIMASNYSLKAGNLWALTILFTIVLDFLVIESFLIYRSSVFVYNRQLDLREQKFHPVPIKRSDNKISSNRFANIDST